MATSIRSCHKEKKESNEQSVRETFPYCPSLPKLYTISSQVISNQHLLKTGSVDRLYYAGMHCQVKHGLADWPLRNCEERCSYLHLHEENPWKNHEAGEWCENKYPFSIHQIFWGTAKNNSPVCLAVLFGRSCGEHLTALLRICTLFIGSKHFYML